MKLIIKFALAVSMVMVLNQMTEAQNATPATDARAVYGQVTKNVYTNSVIGLRIPLPKELEIDPPNLADAALIPTQVPGSMFAGQRMIIKNLFSGRAFPVIMMCTATKLPPKLAKATGEQILNDRLFREPNGPAAKVETLGSNTLAYVDGKTRFNENRSYAIVRKGYYISIVLGFKEKGDLDVMRQYLAQADFDWTGK
jgi:hypothetical protein